MPRKKKAQAQPAPVRATTRAALATALGGSVSGVKTWLERGHIDAMPEGGWDVEAVRTQLDRLGIKPGRNGRPRAIHRAAGVLGAAGAPPASSGDSAKAPGPTTPAPLDLAQLGAAPGAEGETVESLVAKEGLAKARSAFWRARAEELRAQREAGLVVDRAAAEAVVVQAVALARTKLLALAWQLAPALARESDARTCERLLDEALRAVFDELSRAAAKATELPRPA